MHREENTLRQVKDELVLGGERQQVREGPGSCSAHSASGPRARVKG
jgi:hypothetical protein